MKRLIAGIAVVCMALQGCGGEAPVEPASAPVDESPAAPAPAPKSPSASTAAAPAGEAIPMRNFAAVKIGPYDVQPMFEEEIPNGHYNIKVAGGEVKAVRMWVGPEDASGVMVVKTEPENDYNHGHVEVPNPVPDDAKLWIEIEDPAGVLHKGHTPLKLAS